MDASVRLEAVEAARDLLQRFQAECTTWQDVATPVEEIAAWLGCEIATFHPEDYPSGTYGFLEPGEQLIWLCRDLPATLQRFTLAHELGHVVLHSHIPLGHDLPASSHARSLPLAEPGVSSDDPCQIQDIQEELTGLLSQQQAEELLGPGATYDPRSQRELAANLFAAELLMPLHRVWELYVKQQISPDALALLFNVSQAAILNRLAGLLTEQNTVSANEVASLEVDKEKISLAENKAVPPAQTASRKSYDEFQQAAIEAPTPALIVAGPGSGKTSTLIGRADYLLSNQGVRPEQILALTFSRKAAQEMQERLEKILPAGLPPPTISTFHSFCAELLRTYGQHVGLRQDFELVDDAGGYFLLHSLAEDLPLRHYQNLHNPAAPFVSFLKAISRAKDELVTPTRYYELAAQMLNQAADEPAIEAAERALEIAAVYEMYQRALEQRGDSDFGGLIMLTVHLLQEHEDIRAEVEQRYQHILVDEFQDINRASGVLLRLLAGAKQQVWVVGDANQAIYGFRGASPANIANFRSDYPSARVLPLSRNYRSRPDIVHLADTFRRSILEQDPALASVQTARASESDPYITLAVAANEVSELRELVRDIQQKLQAGYNYRDIVVLCRTRAMVRKVTRALAEADLPVDERGGILEQEHIKNLLSLLLLMGDDSGMGILRAARLPAHHLEPTDVEALLRDARIKLTSPLSLILREEFPANLSLEGSRTLGQLATILKHLYHTGSSVWLVLARYLLVETSTARALLESGKDEQARSIRADYARLLQYAHTYDQHRQAAHRLAEERARERGADPPSQPGTREQIAGFLEYFQVLLSLRQESEGKREEGEEEMNEEPNILRVMTVHASKGLEFPVVYLPGLTTRRFPLQRRPNPTPAPAGMLAPESEGERAHESGEACLFYVGATRARDRLILSYSERYGKQNAKRSGYIDALVVGLPDERVQRIYWSSSEPGATPVLEEITPPLLPSQEFIQDMQPAKLRGNQIDDYQICPRRYAYSTIYDFQRNEGSFLPFWKATRDTLKVLVEQQSGSNQPSEREQVAELFRNAWHHHGGNERPFAQLYERHGQEIIEQIWRQLLEEQANGWQLHHNLTVEVAGRSIEVSIDRVEAATPGGQPTKFVRTRVGRTKGKPTAGTRELLYLHARRQHHPGQDITLESHNLSTGESHEIKITSRKEESLLREVEQAVAGIEKQDFAPRPDAYVCPTCPFYLICPA